MVKVLEQTHGLQNKENQMKIEVNINKAKDITKDRLREERKPLLEEQDVLYMRAQEANEDTTAIVAEKQRLRDITNAVDSMTTVEELKGATCEPSA